MDYGKAHRSSREVDFEVFFFDILDEHREDYLQERPLMSIRFSQAGCPSSRDKAPRCQIGTIRACTFARKDLAISFPAHLPT
jgi:hypothetical protein